MSLTTSESHCGLVLPGSAPSGTTVSRSSNRARCPSRRQQAAAVAVEEQRKSADAERDQEARRHRGAETAVVSRRRRLAGDQGGRAANDAAQSLDGYGSCGVGSPGATNRPWLHGVTLSGEVQNSLTTQASHFGRRARQV